MNVAAVQRHLKRNALAYLAALPMALTVLIAYMGTMFWSVRLSFSSSRMLPKSDFVGFAQYERLFSTSRWVTSLENLLVIAFLFLAICFVLGFLLAVFIDQKIKAESFFRTVFLFPYAMSFIVTGLVWQWIFNPQLGIQKTMISLGWESFSFDWIVNPDMVLYTVVIAAVWQGAGLVMALLLAGLRGIDEDLWKATKIDGIPTWRVYISIILPMLRPMIITTVVLLSISIIKMYDVVVAMTGGGPGVASEVPAKFIMDNLFERANIGLATAASTVMLTTVLCLIAPFIYSNYIKK
ncbi:MULTISPECIES: carbohydrate ABC transporter permease [Vibrio]|jgi:glucose/mannose transport system permease protein|uniref:Carbohydrate ABC transporter membrane protein 1 (CUT1 family) n=3 Tax=Vibrio TaxID=662 RepID=A0A2J8HDZ3_VIBDI|nr:MULTISPECIES: sugar ABC transporter permease [Vibrio]MCZ4371087.1 sugar ABC transporter permease [Vibrio diazotrophicus]MDW6017338.1 sugar ABC transporter permease [Vibrio plantisponsor]NNM40280.1 sugar ABC transporter permease [Vibrio plantisponsor]PNH82651.1 sugar ABC transporter permease [Vibrio diazotrophicus]PNH87734.1 sugar ABC transporter permease [Vibrio diazotrophicus]